MNRRSFIRISSVLAAGAGATGLVMAADARRPEPQGQDDFCLSRQYGHVRIHAIQTGALSVKAAHLDLLGPSLTRNLSLVFDPRWTTSPFVITKTSPRSTPVSSASFAWRTRCRSEPCIGMKHSGRVRRSISFSSSRCP